MAEPQLIRVDISLASHLNYDTHLQMSSSSSVVVNNDLHLNNNRKLISLANGFSCNNVHVGHNLLYPTPINSCTSMVSTHVHSPSHPSMSCYSIPPNQISGKLSPTIRLHTPTISPVKMPNQQRRYTTVLNANYASCTMLTFILLDIKNIEDIIKLLFQRGVHINPNSQFWIYTKPALIPIPSCSRDCSNHLLHCDITHHFDFDQQSSNNNNNNNNTNSSSTTPTKTTAHAQLITLDSQSSKLTLRSFINNTNFDLDCDTTMYNSYALEIHIDRDQWNSNLEVAIACENLSKINQLIKSISLPFYTYEYMAKSVGFNGSGTPSNHYDRHAESYSIQSVEYAVKMDKSECFWEILCASQAIKLLESDRCQESINRARTINCLCYYMSMSLHHHSKKCFSLLIWIWLNFIGEPLEHSGIFDKFIQSLLKQLLFVKNKNVNLKDSMDENSNVSLDFITWLSSITEPSSLSDNFWSKFEDDDLYYAHSLGRTKRYQTIKKHATHALEGTSDVAMIILDYDGFTKQYNVQTKLNL